MSKKKIIRIAFLSAFVIILGLGISAAWVWFGVVKGKAIKIDGFTYELFIYPGYDFKDLEKTLVDEAALQQPENFRRLADYMNYIGKVKPGRYILAADIRNVELIRLLRSGQQEPIHVTVPAKRSTQEIAEQVAEEMMFTADELVQSLNDTFLLASVGLNVDNAFALFIPETYYLNWNTTADEFVIRMKQEFDNFWNDERMAKAARIGMDRLQVVSLASIVQAETYRNSEKPTIAGVYINRLQEGWKLQADPTVIFAHGDWSIRRVLKKHLEIDSPYNTYKNEGIPPGPINNPEPTSIDAVLDFKEHKYMYFCAKEDFSGYHNFATTLREHEANADRYKAKLNELERQRNN